MSRLAGTLGPSGRTPFESIQSPCQTGAPSWSSVAMVIRLASAVRRTGRREELRPGWPIAVRASAMVDTSATVVNEPPSDVEVRHFHGVFLDVLSAGLDFLAHQYLEEHVRAGGVVHG